MTDAVQVPAGTPRPVWVFVAGSLSGIVILAVSQVLSETRLSFGPWSLEGNGSLAVPFIGFPVAIYAGWTVIADRAEGRALATAIALYSIGLALGAGVMGLIFALPMCVIAAAIYTTFRRGRVGANDALLWVAFAISAALGALPVLGIFGVALLPGSLISLAHGKTRGAQIGLGLLLAVTATLIVFGVPALLAQRARPA